LLLALLTLTPLSGCVTLGWYAQAAGGQIELLAKREDIENVIAAPATDPVTRQRLELVLEAREFAQRELALPHQGSYGQFVALERDAVVYNVIAAPKLSLKPKTWCYPLVGCLAYRGWFRREAAEREAARLARRGFDTRVAPVAAYSTLGWFDDPVTQPMLAYDEAALAGLIFHELAHQRVFVPGDTEFNEAYATVVEREGLRRFLSQRDSPELLAAWQRRQALQQALTRALLDARDQLAAWYATSQFRPLLLAGKQALFARLQTRLNRILAARPGRPATPARERNNADLALVASYQAHTDAFADLLAKYNGEFAQFHQAVERLEQAGCQARAEFLDRSRNHPCRD